MEAEERTIIVSSSKAQRKYAIQSKATTLGEFKEECRNAGIDYNGLIFKEAISNTEMLNDNSLLPREVLYKGSKTNNLVFALTTPRKNIGSGASSRQEVCAMIREMGLQETVKQVYGDNYTRISTDNLLSIINTSKKHNDERNEKPCTENTTECKCTNKQSEESDINTKLAQLRCMLKDAVELIDDICGQRLTISLNDDDVIDNILNGL